MNTYRLRDQAVLRDERSTGTAKVGFIWLRGQPTVLNIIDEMTCDFLLSLRKPAKPDELASVILRYFRDRGRSLSLEDGKRATELLLRETVRRGWVGAAEDGRASEALIREPAPSERYRDGWAPLSAPLDLAISVTLACNLRCRHCGISCGPDTARPEELAGEEVARLLDMCDQLGVYQVTLTGGEITIRKDWRRLLEAAQNSCYRVSMVTNGVSLSRDDIDFLSACARGKAEGFNVTVSLDGASPETHGFMRGAAALFDRTTANIAALTAAGVTVHVGMTVTPLSAVEINAMIQLAERLGVSKIEFHPAEVYGRSKNHPETWLKRSEVRRHILEVERLRPQALKNGIDIAYETKRVPHTRSFLTAHGVAFESRVFAALRYSEGAHDAGLTKCCIASDGDVYPSEKAQALPALAMGNVKHRHLQEIWLSNAWDFFRGGWRLSDLHQCVGCPIFADCATRNNRIIPYVSLGDPLAAMPECQESVVRWSRREENPPRQDFSRLV